MTVASSGRSKASTLEVLSSSLALRRLRLQRSWPRDEQHLLFEAVGPDGTVAGQWFASSARAARVALATTGAEQLGSIVLQPAGADRRLAFLSQYVNVKGTVLIAHRPERRAVLRLTTDTDRSRWKGGTRTVFTKLVRRGKVAALARTAGMAAVLPARTPQVLAVDESAGSVTTAALPGVSLHDLLGSNDAIPACLAAGAALARLHRAPLPSGLTVHRSADERRVVARWRHLADSHGLQLASFDSAGNPTALPPDELAQHEVAAEERTLIHRDFHDKQIIIDSHGTAGVLDFDLMAVGDPMLDLANLLVHLKLRAVQGLVADAPTLRAAVLVGYQPTPEQQRRMPALEQTTWARLAAVYAFRCPGVAT